MTKTNERLFQLDPLAHTTVLKISFSGINLKGPEISIEGPVTGPEELTFKTAAASLVMKKDGTITIRGKDINIRGSGQVNVKGDQDVVVKGKKILEN